MKKLLFPLLLAMPLISHAGDAAQEIKSHLKGLNISSVDLTDGTLWLKMNFEEAIPQVLAKSVIFSDVCLDMYLSPERWEKYAIKKIKVTTLSEYKAYIFNGGPKECNAYLMGEEEKYGKAPYFEEWIRK